MEIVRTIYGAKLQTAMLLGVPYVFDDHTTLNEKYNIQDGVLPDANVYTRMQYYGIGSGGQQVVADADGNAYISPVPHRPSDAALFKGNPFVLRLTTDDLTADQRANYALRKQEEHNGKQYFAYYLKRIPMTGVTPTMYDTTIKDGVATTVPFVPTSDNLNPVQPTLAPTGVSTNNGDFLSVSAQITITFDAFDVEEYAAVAKILYGDVNYATISEIALCSGADRQVSGATATGTTINYNEAIGVQVVSFLSTYHSMGFTNEGFDLRVELGATEPLLTETTVSDTAKLNAKSANANQRVTRMNV